MRAGYRCNDFLRIVRNYSNQTYNSFKSARTTSEATTQDEGVYRGHNDSECDENHEEEQVDNDDDEQAESDVGNLASVTL